MPAIISRLYIPVYAHDVTEHIKLPPGSPGRRWAFRHINELLKPHIGITKLFSRLEMTRICARKDFREFKKIAHCEIAFSHWRKITKLNNGLTQSEYPESTHFIDAPILIPRAVIAVENDERRNEVRLITQAIVGK